MTLLLRLSSSSMRRFTYILIALLGLVSAISCGPSRYMLDVEVRHESRAGVDLTGKNVTIVHGLGGVAKLDSLLASMADGFAWNLKDRYQDALGNVNVCSLRSASDYANRDSMLNLLVETGADLLFLMDKVQLQSSTVSFILYCYDGMNQEDKVQLFSGSSVLESVTDYDQLKAQGWEAGKEIALAFEPQWKQEQYSLYYFDSEAWYDAINKAEAFDWKGAIDIWIGLLQTNNTLKRACASYNIATASYMSGDYELAVKWLDAADKDAELVVSPGLRKRIDAKR